MYRLAIVGGCGHVGLPLGIALAEAGFSTYLYDIDRNRVDKVNQGILPHFEEGGEEKLKKVLRNGSLSAGTDKTLLSEKDVLIFTTGTPIDEYLNPKIHQLFQVIEELIPMIKADKTLIFRSTLYPGTSKMIFDLLQEKGLSCSVAFCPERIVQGKGLEEIRNQPQIISAFDEKGLAVARKIFGKISSKSVIEVKPIEAELAKLFCNAWRYIHFAVSNQFYQIAEKAGADFERIHFAVTHDYPRMQGFAKAGFAAGPCLLKDTMQLAAFSQNTFFLGHSALLINEGMPDFVVDLLKKRLKKTLRGVKVAILGMTFKANNDDTRDSLCFKLKKILKIQGAQVVCHDPFLKKEDFPHLPLVSLDTALEAEGIILGVPHKAYEKISISPPQTVVDIWGYLQ